MYAEWLAHMAGACQENATFSQSSGTISNPISSIWELLSYF